MSRTEETSTHRDRLTTGEVARVVLAAVIVVALVVFCAWNTDDTNIDYLIGDSNAPLFVVLAASAVAGALIAAC